MRSTLFFTFCIPFLFATCLNRSESEEKNERDESLPVGVVSSAHPFATEAGLNTLREGGNAFDAAVTIAATLNVVEPMMSGIGGYGTILIYHAEENQVRFLDSSGKIPIKTNSDLMRPPTPGYLQNRKGAKAVSTPGNVNAWFALSEQYGNLSWSQLFEHPIRLAEEGIPVSRMLGRYIGSAFSSFSDYSKSFYGKDGKSLEEGDVLIQQDLAKSLRLIANKGIAEFYLGSIARSISKSMEESGGFLSFEDLKNDKAEWWEPISINYGEYDIYTASPPATAFPSLIRLGLMKQFDDLEHNSADYLHIFAEVTKFAYAARLKYAGDPEVNPPPLDSLLSNGFLEKSAGGLDPRKASEFQKPVPIVSESKNTTHFVVADQWGNIVSATQTLGNLFGSRIMPEGTGIWLNNSLAYCTYEPKGNPMDAIPGQRKLSGDCPTIIFQNKRPWIALGTPGGHTIGQTVPQIVLNLIEFNMELKEAVDAPRISFVEPSHIAIEFGIGEVVFKELASRGHQVRRVRGLGNAQALQMFYDENGTLVEFRGAADGRGEGKSKVIN